MSKELADTLGQRDGVEQALAAVAATGQKLLAGEKGSRESLVASARELLHQAERPMDSVAWSFLAQVHEILLCHVFFEHEY